MKMTDADYKVLGKIMDQAIEKYGYERWAGHRNCLENPTDTRMAWDLLHAMAITIGDGAGQPGTVNWYSYLNDDHINTAMLKCYRAKHKSEIEAVVIEDDGEDSEV